MKWNFRWGKNNKQEMSPELTERGVNVYHHENKIKGAEHLGERQCVECGKWFKPNHAAQLICSDDCRIKRIKRRKSEWMKKTYEARRQVEAVNKVETRKEKPMLETKKCIICGQEFHPYNRNQNICGSDECRREQARRYAKVWYHKNSDTVNAKKRAQYAGESAPKPVKVAKQNKHLETAAVISKLIKAGVDDDVVAKYLQTVYGE